MHVSLDTVNNYKNSNIEESKPKAKESKALNSNNSLCFDQKRNIKTFDKAQKEKKKY